MAEVAPLNPEKIIKTLDRFKVKYILVGALAARLQGFPRMTADADITPAMDDENLKNLAKALQKMDARVLTEHLPQGLPFDCSAKNLKKAKIWNLVTSAGRLDIIFEPGGTSGYKDLIGGAKRFEAFGATLYVSSIQDIIRSKKVADRPQDRQDIIILNEILKRNT